MAETEQPYFEYEELPGEREYFVAMCGGELEYKIWCYLLMYGSDRLGPFDCLI